MKKVPLSEVLKYIRGITFKPSDIELPHTLSSVVCMRTKNVQTLLDQSDLIAVNSNFVKREEQYLEEGDLLISSANSWNLVGKTCYVPALPYKATAGGFISIARPNRNLIAPRYLYHWLSSDQTQHYVRLCGQQTTNISNLNRERFLALRIPLPPLDEQRRIAAILDKADAVRRKRQEAIRLTEELLRSLFLDMFGDPVTNPKGWSMKPMNEVIQHIEAGWSANGEERKAESNEWGVLKISAVTSGRFREYEHKAVEALSSKKSLIIPQRGDLLFSRANTRELVAATCLVEKNYENLFLPDKLWRIKPNPALATAEYLRFLLSDTKYRSLIARKATGTSGSMLNVSQAKLLEMDAVIPPLNVQKRFAEMVWQVFEIRKRYELASNKVDNLFNSLLQRAFRGEL